MGKGRFLIGAGASVVSPTAGHAARFRAPIDPFNAQRDRVAHPPPDDRVSFDFWVDADGRLLVADPSLTGKFDSPNRDNLLYWPGRTSHPDDALMIAQPGGVPTWWVRLARAVRAPEALKPGRSWTLDAGPVGRDVYVQSDRQPDSFQAVGLAAAPGPISRRPDGTLNPLVLSLPLDGEDITGGGLGGVYRRAVAEGSVLFAEPVAGPEEDPRAVFWHEFERRVLERGRPATVLEALFLGPLPCRAGSHRAFLTLDRLGGVFVLEGPDASPARYGWMPPRGLKGTNAEWLSTYWLRRWGGDLLDSIESTRPYPSPCDAAGHLGRIAPAVSDLTVEVTRKTLPGLAGSAGKSLRRLALAYPDDPALAVAAAVLRHPALSRAAGSHRGSWRVTGPGASARRLTVGFDRLGFLDHFARGCVLPRSSVRVRYPSGPFSAGKDLRPGLSEGHDRTWRALYYPLSTPPALEAGRLLSRLLESTAAGPPEEGLIRLAYRFGWWEAHLDALARRGRGARLVFEPPAAGFVLGRSRVGLGRVTAAAGPGRSLTLSPVSPAGTEAAGFTEDHYS